MNADEIKTQGRLGLTPDEVATRWGVCRQTIYNMIGDGQIKSFKIRNRRLIHVSEVERIEAGTKSTP